MTVDIDSTLNAAAQPRTVNWHETLGGLWLTAFFDEPGVLRNGRGVLASVDGGATWEPVDRGLRNRNATSLAISGDGRHLFVGTIGGSVHRITLSNP